MRTIDLTTSSDESMRDRLAPAALAVKAGGLVVVPTTTYYALAADALNPAAVARVFSAKRRDRTKPIIALCDSFEMVKPLVVEIPRAARELEWRLGGKGLTYVLAASTRVPLEMTSGTGTIAVRIERNEVVRELLALVGQPITGTSANVEGRPPPRTADDAAAQLRDWLEVVVRSHPSGAAAATTIVDLTRPGAPVLREGTVLQADIRKALGQ
ncbi:MAG: threonylcarbamoyl-AMP synthase [Candidatus Eisenbacteria bacterium]|nr:threonylcarbamoyl-AMP synthase [Candidatus Eisenbacteria bacterium]